MSSEGPVNDPLAGFGASNMLTPRWSYGRVAGTFLAKYFEIVAFSLLDESLASLRVVPVVGPDWARPELPCAERDDAIRTRPERVANVLMRIMVPPEVGRACKDVRFVLHAVLVAPWHVSATYGLFGQGTVR